MDFGSELDKVSEFLTRRGYRYALVGGHALAALGQPRTTLDLDLVVDGDAQDALVAFMETEGYETLHRSEGYSNHLHPSSDRGRVDFVYVRGRTAEELFSGCREATGPGGRPVPVPRPEHLAAMKVLAMRNDPGRRHQELADIRSLMGLPGIQTQEIRAYFERYGLEEEFDDLEASL